MARSKPYGLSKESAPYLLAGVAIAATVHLSLGFVLAVPFWLGVGLLGFCFRKHDRVIPASPLGIVSPGDGKIISVDEVVDPFLQRPAKRITLQLNPWGEYTLRSPTEGKLVNHWRLRRKGVASVGATRAVADESVLRERARQLDGLWIQTDEADDVVLELPVRPWPKPRCYGNVGERVGQGHRCGFLPFGGRLAVYVPANAKILVEIGQTVCSGSDLIATLVHD